MRIGRADASRFGALWRRCVSAPPSPDGAKVYADLRARLGGRGRAFHNLGHIDDCLRRFDEVTPQLDDRDAVEVAIWFHDAVYEPGDPTNERRSAELFLKQSAGGRAHFRRRVCALILTTRRNRTPRSNDCKFIDDIDLAGFGAAWDDFMHNGDLLRREFAEQSDGDYYRGLTAFLGMLRRRPRFFRTDYFAERYEKQAHANLDRLLADIAKQGHAPR
jgi:predicted metal-dependent HD superfamily phosphohydrolase